MEKIWLKSYPANVPAEIDADLFKSLIDLFDHSFNKYAERPAFSSMGTELSYAELDKLSTAFANHLQQVLGLKKGDRIAIMLPNILQFPIAFLGALKAGLVVTNINPLYTPPELAHQLHDCGARAILVLANSAHTLEQALSGTAIEKVIVTELGDGFPKIKRILVNAFVKRVKHMVPSWHIESALNFVDVLEEGKKLTRQPVALTGDDLALLQYTGGTTGVPKGAELTHRNLVANILQSIEWVGSCVEPGHETVLVALPLYHIFSLTVCCLAFFSAGAHAILIPDARRLKDLIKALKQYRVSVFIGLNTLFHGLLMQAEFREMQHHYKLTVAGGMPTHNEVADDWLKVTGCMILEGYGLTEMSPIVSINPTNLERFNRSIGLPISSTEVSIRDENAKELAINEEGELWVRGPQRMRAYWNNPAETKASIDAEGWFATGDMVKMSEQGFMTVVGRKNDLILVSGFKVFPDTVENVIASNPKVSEVAVIGVDDPNSGEAIKAYIIKKDPSLTKEELMEYCHHQLTGYRIPKYVEFVDSLPRSNVGKVLYRVLREQNKK